jgi:diguanylate cyclase (GGDEF)-like protein/PAS domain S-box-containing protein
MTEDPHRREPGRRHRLRAAALPALVALAGAAVTVALSVRVAMSDVDWQPPVAWRLAPLDLPILLAGLALSGLLAAQARRVHRARAELHADVADARRARDRYAGFLEAVLGDIDVAIVACDEHGRITISNEAAQRMLGPAAPTGLPGSWITEAWRRIAPEVTLEDLPLHRALHGEQVIAEEIVLPFPEGRRVLLVSARPLLDGGGRPAGAVLSAHDITARTAAEAEMQRLAMQDHLTGLANRRRLSADLRHALLARSAGGPDVTVLFMDLDGFKQVNDTVGHHRGDRMLVDIAERLRLGVHAGDVVARIGGDEFVVLCTHCTSPRAAEDLAAAALGAVGPALRVDGVEVGTGVSIGVVRPTSDASVDDVLRFADLAMYEAKSRRGTSVQVYEPELGRRAAGQQALELALRRAVRDGAMTVHYQPVVDLVTRETTAAEALVRWEEDGEVRSPATFLPLAEANGLIVDIDLWVLQQACAAVTAPGGPAKVNVNLSARTLALPDLDARVEAALAAVGAAPGQLCIELTETALIGASEATDRALAHLSAIGVGLALDDFGTGYATLDHLRRFPVDTVKIDRSFVRHMTASAGDREIVSSTIHLARRLGLTTVAEGVETPAQAALLDEMGCDQLQGYLLGRPMTLDALRAHLAGGQDRTAPASA